MTRISAKGVVVVIIVIPSILRNPVRFTVNVVIFFNRKDLVLVSVFDVARESHPDTVASYNGHYQCIFCYR